MRRARRLEQPSEAAHALAAAMAAKKRLEIDLHHQYVRALVCFLAFTCPPGLLCKPCARVCGRAALPQSWISIMPGGHTNGLGHMRGAVFHEHP